MRRWTSIVAAVPLIAAAWAFRTTSEVHVESAPVTNGPITRHVFATGTVQPVPVVDVGQTPLAAVQAPVLFRIATDLTRVQVQVDVDESDVAGLTAGEPASVEVESYPGATFRGTVATVVSYGAIIDVENSDERLRPGMTAEVALVGARRSDVVRIPNSALAFRPPPEVLRTLRDDDAFPTDRTGAGDSDTRPQFVWEFDGHRFTPVAVRIGLSDGNWTERLSGPIRPGDALVTTAVLRQRPRL